MGQAGLKIAPRNFANEALITRNQLGASILGKRHFLIEARYQRGRLAPLRKFC